MSVDAILSRISEIHATLQPQTPAAGTSSSSAFATQLGEATAHLPGSTAFAASSGSATSGAALPTFTPGLAAPVGVSATAAMTPTGAMGGTAGARMVAAAQAEVGVAEQPPGSNDGPRIAEYRTATSGSGVGPWCAYFTSWLAKNAGAPLGEAGQGFGAVSAVYGWAERTGHAIPAGQGTPQAGDLIVWNGRHIGVVESVEANGSIHTIEGNSSNAVTRRTYGADGGGATGYVRV